MGQSDMRSHHAQNRYALPSIKFGKAAILVYGVLGRQFKGLIDLFHGGIYAFDIWCDFDDFNGGLGICRDVS